MSRHSQVSSLSTTLADLGSLTSKKRAASINHGRRRAKGLAKTSLTPMLFKVGGAAATSSLTVSGAAYAIISAGDGGGSSSSGGSFGLISGESDRQAKAAATLKADAGKIVNTQTSTTTVDEPRAHSTVKEGTDSPPKSETKVETAGVNGLMCTTYEVATQGSKEVFRIPTVQVVVIERMGEAVPAGTGEQQDQQTQQAQQGAAQQTQSAGDGQAAQANGSSEDSSSSTPAPAANPGAGVDPDSTRVTARSMMVSHNWGDSEFSYLESLWTRESSWNHRTKNASSGAYGISQTLPDTKVNEVADDWTTDLSTQITRGLGYISGHYGTPYLA